MLCKSSLRRLTLAVEESSIGSNTGDLDISLSALSWSSQTRLKKGKIMGNEVAMEAKMVGIQNYRIESRHWVPSAQQGLPQIQAMHIDSISCPRAKTGYAHHGSIEKECEIAFQEGNHCQYAA